MSRAKPSTTFPLLTTLRDGPAWLGPVLALKAFGLVGLVLPMVLGIVLNQGTRYFAVALPGGVFVGLAILAAWALARVQGARAKRAAEQGAGEQGAPSDTRPPRA